jgi:hypothetical protein
MPLVRLGTALALHAFGQAAPSPQRPATFVRDSSAADSTTRSARW